VSDRSGKELGLRLGLVLTLVVVGLVALWITHHQEHRAVVARAIAVARTWPMGASATPLEELLRRTHALSPKAPIRWEGTATGGDTQLVRLVARLEGPDAASLTYAFDVDVADGRLFAANPRARWLFGAWPPEPLSPPTASD